MQYTQALDLPPPLWSEATARRLRACLGIAGFTILALIVLIRLPQSVGIDLPRVLSVILIDEAADEEEPDMIVEPPLEELPLPSDRIPRTSPSSVAAEDDSPVDWNASAVVAVRETLDDQERPAASANPLYDARVEDARRSWRPSRAVRKRPIWENVEKDMTGRTILRSGDCYRVLDDPNVTNRWVFETFHQHMVFCDPKSIAPTVGQVSELYAWLDQEQPAIH